MITYTFKCSCCHVERTEMGRGKKRATYWYNGQQIDGIDAFAELMGLHKNTVTWRLKGGLCLREGLRVSLESRGLNNRPKAERSSTAILAARFCRMPRPAVW